MLGGIFDHCAGCEKIDQGAALCHQPLVGHLLVGEGAQLLGQRQSQAPAVRSGNERGGRIEIDADGKDDIAGNRQLAQALAFDPHEGIGGSNAHRMRIDRRLVGAG